MTRQAVCVKQAEAALFLGLGSLWNSQHLFCSARHGTRRGAEDAASLQPRDVTRCAMLGETQNCMVQQQNGISEKDIELYIQ